MNLARLRAFVARNKMTLGLAGAGVVALLALRARTGATATPAGAGGAGAPTYPGGSGYSAGYQASGYDSSATDIYNQLQPQIEDLRDRLNEQPTSEDPPVPVPLAPDADAGYFRPGAWQTVYRLTGDGKLDWLSAGEYAALGSPDVKSVPVSDTFWQREVLGGRGNLDQLLK